MATSADRKMDAGNDHCVKVAADPADERLGVLDCPFSWWHPNALVWRVLHVVAFLLGGTTFIAGSAVLFEAGNDRKSALLYILGSAGFLFVDVQEFFTYSDPILRVNFLLSASGSLLYLVGSVGFLPKVVAEGGVYTWIGIWGFIVGSAYIGWSQLWKVFRIGGGETRNGWQLTNYFNRDSFTAAGQEAGAGIGAWFFFAGTLLYNQGPLAGPHSKLKLILRLWTAGSCFFTTGGLFMFIRHFVLDLA